MITDNALCRQVGTGWRWSRRRLDASLASDAYSYAYPEFWLGSRLRRALGHGPSPL